MGERGYIIIDSGVRKVCIMSHCLFNKYMDTVTKEVTMGMWKMGMRSAGREIMEIAWSLVSR